MMKLSLFLLFILNLHVMEAQEAVPAAGNNASGSGGTVSYTVGQVLYTTNTIPGGSVAPGVQQPYEISVLTSTIEQVGINLTWNIYPNPASDYLHLHIADPYHFYGSIFS